MKRVYRIFVNNNACKFENCHCNLVAHGMEIGPLTLANLISFDVRSPDLKCFSANQASRLNKSVMRSMIVFMLISRALTFLL